MTLGGHVEGGPAAKVRGPCIGGCQSKIRQLDAEAAVADEDILRFEVAVVDAERVAVLHCVQQLQKHPACQHVRTHVAAALRDARKQVSLAAELHDDKDGVRGVQDLDERDNVWVRLDPCVQVNLAGLEAPLPLVQPELGEGLDGVRGAGVDVDGHVDDAVRADAEDAGEFQAAVEQLAQPVFWAHGRDGGGGWDWGWRW